MALKNNTWTLNQWYDQDVAGNVSYSGAVGGFFGWGRNSEGDLAQNSTAVAHYSSPIQVSTDSTWNFYPAGHSFVAGENLLTKTDGTLWSWGYNLYGQLGHNNLTEYSSPTQIPGTDWSTAIGSRGVSYAVKTNGTLWAMGGYNAQGSGGVNNIANFSSPIQIPGTTWGNKIYGNNTWAGAIKTDGTLWVWGYGKNGQLGQNNTVQYSSPVQIPGTNWNRMSSGSEESAMATKTDGTLWFWGYANHGGPGNGGGGAYAYSSPIQVGTATDWALGEYKSSIGQYGQCNVIKTDGTLWSWGYTSYGICGDTQNHSSPVQMPGTNWNAVSNSYARYIIATKTDGTLWSWGDNSSWMGGALFGDLAQGTRRSSPVQLPGTTVWDHVVATRRNAFARNIL